MKLASIESSSGDLRGCTAWFKSLSRQQQAKVLYTYFDKINSMSQPVSQIDLWITKVQLGIADPDYKPEHS